MNAAFVLVVVCVCASREELYSACNRPTTSALLTTRTHTTKIFV